MLSNVTEQRFSYKSIAPGEQIGSYGRSVLIEGSIVES
jgi:hypothetical protein